MCGRDLLLIKEFVSSPYETGNLHKWEIWENCCFGEKWEICALLPDLLKEFVSIQQTGDFSEKFGD